MSSMSSPGSTTIASLVCSSPKIEQLQRSTPTGRITCIKRSPPRNDDAIISSSHYVRRITQRPARASKESGAHMFKTLGLSALVLGLFTFLQPATAIAQNRGGGRSYGGGGGRSFSG